MKAQERFEIITKGLSEGKTKSQIARDMGVTPALVSQIVKKFTPVETQEPKAEAA